MGYFTADIFTFSGCAEKEFAGPEGTAQKYLQQLKEPSQITDKVEKC
jgi:hypothetical protein